MDPDSNVIYVALYLLLTFKGGEKMEEEKEKEEGIPWVVPGVDLGGSK